MRCVSPNSSLLAETRESEAHTLVEEDTESRGVGVLSIWGTSFCWVAPHQHRRPQRNQEDGEAFTGRESLLVLSDD